MNVIGVDVGGTFTDLVWADTDSGAQVIHKVPSTPDDPSRGVMTGVQELCALAGVAHGDVDFVLHGTTIATNAVLEHRGAKVGMITNDGFRDVLHIARHQRVEHYSILQELPWQNRPLIRRQHRKTVAGRLIPPSGAELVPLDEAGVAVAARELRAEGGGGGHMLPVFLSEPRARTARRRDCARRIARRVRDHLCLPLPAIPRI